MHAHERLVAFRRDRELSLTALAKEIRTLDARFDVTSQMLGYIERGDKVPGLAIAAGIERITAAWSSGAIKTTDWLDVPLMKSRRRARQTRRQLARRAA